MRVCVLVLVSHFLLMGTLCTADAADVPNLGVVVNAAGHGGLPLAWGLDLENIFCKQGEGKYGGCDGGVHDHHWEAWSAPTESVHTRTRPAAAVDPTEGELPLYVTHLSVRKETGSPTERDWVDCNVSSCYHGRKRFDITPDVVRAEVEVETWGAGAEPRPQDMACYITRLTFADGTVLEPGCEPQHIDDLVVTVEHSEGHPLPEDTGLDVENKYCKGGVFMGCGRDAVHRHRQEAWPKDMVFVRHRRPFVQSDEGGMVPYHNSWLSVRRLGTTSSKGHDWVDCQFPMCYLLGQVMYPLGKDVVRADLYVSNSSGTDLKSLTCHIEKLAYTSGRVVDIRQSFLCKLFYKRQ